MTTVNAVRNFKMFTFLFGLAIVGGVVSSPAPKKIPTVQIVGGGDIDIKDAPYQVALVIKNPTKSSFLGSKNELSFDCGGTIVAHDIVVTAAHCAGAKPTDYQVRVGSSSYSEGGELYPVSDFVVHENFGHNDTNDNDIAVIRLLKPIKFNNRVSSISMVEKNEEIKEGEATIVTGWGYTQEHNYTLSKALQMVKVPIVSEESCRTAYAKVNETITSRMLCAGLPAGGKDSCQGDSGGPLVYNGKLAGVVSFGEGCARPGFPGVYAKVSALRKWIDDTISKLRLQHLNNAL